MSLCTVALCCAGGLGEEVSLMLAWEIHNHWSHCWALIRPAVSSPKGQKSIPLHYRASMVISTHASSPVQHNNNKRTHPYNKKNSLLLGPLYGSDVCLLLIMWLRSDGLYCETRSFSKEKCNSLFLKKQQTIFSTPMITKEHITGSKW